MKLETAKKLVTKAVAFFDVRSGCGVDLVTEGKKVVFIDPLNTKIEANPTSTGHNDYRLVQEACRFEHPIKFQSGAPTQGVNGLSNEAVIATVLHRLNRQNESYPSAYNTLSILFLQGALTALQARVKDRTEFGIYGTDKVAPEGEEEAKFAHALAMINSMGILQNVIFKFDHAYGLNLSGKVHELLEQVGKFTKPAEDGEANIITAFMLSSSSLAASGFIKSTLNLAASIMAADKATGKGNDQNPTANDPA